MAIYIAPEALNIDLNLLMMDVASGKAQLPEFQRSWTWNNTRIIGILASLSQGYPMGAIMRLTFSDENMKLKYRMFEGVTSPEVKPDYLVLDGQQRLTSIYRATCSNDPVDTTTEKGQKIKRYYYLDINKCLKENEDREDAVLAIPEDKKIKENFNKVIVLDLSTRDLEYQHEMFPLNIVFDSGAREDWADGYKESHDYSQEYRDKYKKFKKDVLDRITGYKLPVITLGKETPKEAVCKVFENVNTGGVPLTVFELVTAAFATHDFNLRKDWEECRDSIRGKNEKLNTDIMDGVDETAFLTAVTLFTTYQAPTMTTCKKKDVLSLSYNDYRKNKETLIEGYKMARKFLIDQKVFRMRDLPYTTQLVPLAAICAEIGKTKFNQPQTQKILSKWFWCGIMGEMYGSANETRYANDMEDVVDEINGKNSQNRTVNAAYFSATRLISLQTRNSAAYKGIMALFYKKHCLDFIHGYEIDAVKSMDESPDLHHIFPEKYCIKNGYEKRKWNSIINKTPLRSESNRKIGGDAPSEYCNRIIKEGIKQAELRSHVESHLVDYDLFIKDDFDGYFIARAKSILKVIEEAMGKSIADKGSEETIKKYGVTLED